MHRTVTAEKSVLVVVDNIRSPIYLGSENILTIFIFFIKACTTNTIVNPTVKFIEIIVIYLNFGWIHGIGQEDNHPATRYKYKVWTNLADRYWIVPHCNGTQYDVVAVLQLTGQWPKKSNQKKVKYTQTIYFKKYKLWMKKFILFLFMNLWDAIFQ